MNRLNNFLYRAIPSERFWMAVLLISGSVIVLASIYLFS